MKKFNVGYVKCNIIITDEEEVFVNDEGEIVCFKCYRKEKKRKKI